MSANMAYAEGSKTWYPDSGSTNHIAHNMNNIHIEEDCIKFINTSNGCPMGIMHHGNSRFSINNRNFDLNELLYVSTASKNLISVKRFCCDNLVSMEFDPQNVRVRDLETREVLLEGRDREGLYELPLPLGNRMQVNQVSVGIKASARTWHLQLGHLHSKAMKKLNKENLIAVTDVKSIQDSCDDCCITKCQKLQYNKRSTIYEYPLELVFADVWGPVPTVSTEGYWYYLNIIDVATSYNWIFLMRRKS